MSPIVSNATPLIYLAKIGRLGLLRRLYTEVFIPEEVKAEVVDRGKKLEEVDAYTVEKALKDGWLKTLKTEPLEITIRLHPGETAALSLATMLGIREILLDERMARTAARLLGLSPRGTIYVLLRGLEERELSLDDFLESLAQLTQHGFRLKEEAYIEVMKKARQIAEKSHPSTSSVRI